MVEAFSSFYEWSEGKPTISLSSSEKEFTKKFMHATAVPFTFRHGFFVPSIGYLSRWAEFNHRGRHREDIVAFSFTDKETAFIQYSGPIWYNVSETLEKFPLMNVLEQICTNYNVNGKFCEWDDLTICSPEEREKRKAPGFSLNFAIRERVDRDDYKSLAQLIGHVSNTIALYQGSKQLG